MDPKLFTSHSGIPVDPSLVKQRGGPGRPSTAVTQTASNSPAKSNAASPLKTVKPTVFTCPKCTEFKPTKERSALRFHLIEHYVHLWANKVTLSF